MIHFIKLIKLRRHSFEIRIDEITDIGRLLEGERDFDTQFILEVEAVGETYRLDLGKLLLLESSLLPSTNIVDLISKLTQIMLYSYQTNTFDTSNLIRTFNHTDLPGSVVVSPYSIYSHEITNSTYDPSYRDLIISCEDYDLSKVFPIIDGRLYRGSWLEGKIILEDEVQLARTIETIHFISFAETELITKSASELALADWSIEPGKYPIVVIDGAIYTDDDVYAYKFNSSTRLLTINPRFLEQHYQQADYTSPDELLASKNTFIIIMNGNGIKLRHVPIVPFNHVPSACIYYDEVPTHSTDYVCMDSVNRRILDMCRMSDKFTDPLTLESSIEHGVYVNAVDNNIKLVQMVAH